MCTVCVHAVCVLGKCVEMCSWLDGHFGDLIFSFEKDNRIPEERKKIILRRIRSLCHHHLD